MEFGDGFLTMTTKTQLLKKKTNWTSLQLETFVLLRAVSKNENSYLIKDSYLENIS